MDLQVSRQPSTKRFPKTIDTTLNFGLSTQRRVTTIKHSYLRVASNPVTYDELSRSVITNTTWYSNTITWQRRTRNGSSSEFKTLKSSLLTNSTLSISLNQRAHTTKAWSHCSTPKKMQMLKTVAPATVGTEMARTSATSKTSSRKREAVFTTL